MLVLPVGLRIAYFRAIETHRPTYASGPILPQQNVLALLEEPLRICASAVALLVPIAKALTLTFSVLMRPALLYWCLYRFHKAVLNALLPNLLCAGAQEDVTSAEQIRQHDFIAALWRLARKSRLPALAKLEPRL